MDSSDGDKRDVPALDAINDYLASLARQPKQRLQQAVIDDRKVWIKRYDAERQAVGRVIHAAISPLLPSPVLKASRLAAPLGLADREERKIAAFAAAGFGVPQVLLRKDAVLVLSDEGSSLQNHLADLRHDDMAAHDGLLCRAAEMLGQVHAAGLCHGRPHTRDMTVRDGRWCFLDFEEEPEAVMALSAAQARDTWLLFFQITHSAIATDTPARAFAAYRAVAPAVILDDLKILVRTFSRLLPLLRAVLRVRPGGDLGRLRNVTELMVRELAQPAGRSG